MLYKINGLKFEFYEMRVEFTDTDDLTGVHETYVHSMMDINHFLKKPNIINVKVTNVNPTQEQRERLVVVNSSGHAASLSHHAGIEFVKNGLIVPNSLLDDLPLEYHEKSLDFIKYCISEKIRITRQHEEEGGVTVNINGEDIFVRTDSATQSKLVSGKTILENKDVYVVDYLDWELSPFVWDILDLDKISFLSKIVFDHVQLCFTISKNEQQQVKQCTSIADLSMLNLSWFDPREIYPLNLFEEFFASESDYDMDDSSYDMDDSSYDMDDSSYDMDDIDNMTVDEFDDNN